MSVELRRCRRTRAFDFGAIPHAPTPLIRGHPVRPAGGASWRLPTSMRTRRRRRPGSPIQTGYCKKATLAQPDG